jgi:threonine/homoserine/homoserine lactone efflux protein
MLSQIAAFALAATIVAITPGADERVTGCVLVALGLRLATTSR